MKKKKPVRQRIKNIEQERKNLLRNIRRSAQKYKERAGTLKKLYIKVKDETPCTDCGVIKPGEMSYDHARGVKKFNIQRREFRNRSFEEIREEIAKCDIVCRPCHDAREYKRGRTHAIKGPSVQILVNLLINPRPKIKD